MKFICPTHGLMLGSCVKAIYTVPVDVEFGVNDEGDIDYNDGQILDSNPNHLVVETDVCNFVCNTCGDDCVPEDTKETQ